MTKREPRRKRPTKAKDRPGEGRGSTGLRAGSIERVRKNFGACREKMIGPICAELRRFQKAGRIPADIFLMSLEIVSEEIHDEQYELSPSWTDGGAGTRWDPGDRGFPSDPDD